MLKWKVLKKLFVTAEHWKRRCTVLFYVEIIVERKAKQEKEREIVRVLSNEGEGRKKWSLKNVIN